MPSETTEHLEPAGNADDRRSHVVRGRIRESVNALLVCLIGLALTARLHLAFVFEINWDEFFHLSQLYQHARGEITRALQSIYVHAFEWVPLVASSEIDQIVGARLALFILSLGTAAFLFLISRRLLPESAALLAVLCYLSFSFVLRQGNSFRTDPIATFLLMAALWLMICGPARLRLAILAGALVGLAGMVTIKSALYVPTIALVLLVGLAAAGERRRRFIYGLAVAGSAALSFAAFHLLHRLTLPEATSSVASVEGAVGYTIGQRDFTNAVATFRFALLENIVVWLLMAIGLTVCVLGLIRDGRGGLHRWGTLLSCGLILGSLFVYTNSFAYFYPFMLAPAAVLCGASLLAFPERVRPVATAIAAVLVAGSMTVNYASALARDSSAQRQTLEVVHRIFPEPTPYIDRCSMVSAYPKKGFFMSVWGMTGYYRQGTPIFRGILERDQPRFLLANRSMLKLDELGPNEHGPEHFGLFEQDVAILKANYVHHWGAIYVAGKEFSLTDGKSQSFEILIEGTYTVESPVPVRIDGRALGPSETVDLAQGVHRIESVGGDAAVTLRWGDHIYRPAVPAPEGELFTGF